MCILLEIKNLIYSIGSGSIGFSAELLSGTALQVRGPSGAGKTTLLRTIARLNEPENGVILLAGKSWSEFSPALWRRNVHYLPQKPVLFDGSVKYNLLRPMDLAVLQREISFDEKLAVELMDKMQLPTKILEQDARTLSGGEASRVALIRAMLANPKVMLLDEPMASLDGKSAEQVLLVLGEWYKEKTDRGIVIVSHTGELEKLPGLKVLELPAKEGEWFE